MAIVGRPLLASRGLRWGSVVRDSAAAFDVQGLLRTETAMTVTPISGAFTLTAWHKGAVRDSLDGVAEWLTRDGARWRLALDHVQTKAVGHYPRFAGEARVVTRSEEHTSELQSRLHLVCRLLLEKK